MIGQGYLNFDNSAFTKALDGRTTFRTGDIYAKTVVDHLIWKGRKEDYIQVGPNSLLSVSRSHISYFIS